MRTLEQKKVPYTAHCYVETWEIGYQIELDPADLARVIRFDYADLIVE